MESWYETDRRCQGFGAGKLLLAEVAEEVLSGELLGAGAWSE